MARERRLRTDEEIHAQLLTHVDGLKTDLEYHSRRKGEIEQRLAEADVQLVCAPHVWITVGPGLYGNTIYKCQKCEVYNSDEAY